MRRLICGLVVLLTVVGCNTMQSSKREFETAIRMGIEACERHLVGAAPFEGAPSASAGGRAFSLKPSTLKTGAEATGPTVGWAKVGGLASRGTTQEIRKM
jgi:hypothetical protein